MSGRECVPIAIKESSGNWYIHLLWIDENSNMHDDKIDTVISSTIIWVTYTRTDILYG